MKKVLFLMVMASIVAVSAMAQSYTVQNVTGRVQQEKSGQRVELKAGDSISGDTVIHTGIGATLVLKTGDKTMSVSQARSGKVSDLAAAAPGVRISGNVARTNTGAASRGTAQVTTASARASEAAADDDIAAE